MDQGAPPTGPMTPAPTREVVGDLITVASRLVYLIELQQNSEMRLGTAVALLQSGKTEEAKITLQEHLVACHRTQSEARATWVEVLELAKRFSGTADE